MKLQRSGFVAGIALTATIALTACGSDNVEPTTGGTSAAPGDCVSGSLTAQGSTAQKNAMDEWIKAYQTKCGADAKVDYQGTGSGAGIEAFIAGTADFAGSDSALKEEEQPQADAKCAGGKALNLPMVIGPIAVVYNVEGADGLQFSSSTLAKIFAGKITKWDDPAIAAENSGAKLPAANIETVHRADESGTSDNFTKFLSKTAEADWTYGNAKAWKAPGGTAVSKSDGIATKVKGTANTISYIEMSFAENQSLQTAKIKNGAGEYVALSAESAGKTFENAEIKGKDGDLALSLDYATKTAGAYPIVLVTYEIACSKGSGKAKEIQSFLKFASSAEGQKELSELGYAPLPETLRAKVAESVASIA
ncbi:phosphate-binding protein PstS [Actinoplanes italicus]|uniref:Phosphate-binding protein n=1 Tax=Actinoplanes italicus TaxID=113567 RepID=A0A2T0KKW0_9ACTN|nr:phosphate ABC transporter substrate-binding protein PstS [Actinoplanes italicus]PRX24269.1 phosphate ABC transporter substrate-binding protein (PhoT family) [Actinoplanes italicus]GIE28004.1 phosphate-binding protein PstS [Actinoplanes italicus]